MLQSLSSTSRLAGVLAVALSAALAFSGCSDDGQSPAGRADEANPGAESPEPPPVEEPEAYSGHITGRTSLRKQASKDRKVEMEPGKKESNWVATLYRGETVEVLSPEGDWLHVESSGGSKGWLEKRTVLAAEDVRVATALQEMKVFRRPDLLALSTAATIPAGSLLFVTKAKEQFSEVDYPRSAYSSSSAWVLSSKLNTDGQEVAMAKLLNKIRHLQEKGDPGVAPLIEVAKEQYATAKLIALLEPDASDAQDEPKAGSEEAPATAEDEKKPAAAPQEG